ncbi:hypothetical protein NY2A_b191L [Paramecium bursaria Chlorella virus NY2A]|uniref:Uncharacterized protein b191L n=1 Tax=Paramecium bursaria Chlorella virus NY2A TaxID=46021 RepID=A7IW66_PBCVN|nr:hypothetical protein NY2A_b191L [Paramecium bursaria Chlorella virus NY2A]ABT14590.1 hypothetical protein NY2A_b191L [Paramecium bursaria Chlorella virus NY2A]
MKRCGIERRISRFFEWISYGRVHGERTTNSSCGFFGTHFLLIIYFILFLFYLEMCSNPRATVQFRWDVHVSGEMNTRVQFF